VLGRVLINHDHRTQQDISLPLRVSAEKQNEYEGQQEHEGYEHGNIVCR